MQTNSNLCPTAFVDMFLQVLPHSLYKTEYKNIKNMLDKIDIEIIEEKKKYESAFSYKNPNSDPI